MTENDVARVQIKDIKHDINEIKGDVKENRSRIVRLEKVQIKHSLVVSVTTILLQMVVGAVIVLLVRHFLNGAG